MSEDNEWIREIVSLWNQLPKENQSDFQVSFEIIKGLMGLEWLQKHFDPELKKPSVFKIGFGATEEEATRNYRVIDLAELLINLKDVEGFGEWHRQNEGIGESRSRIGRATHCQDALHKSLAVSLR
jgi:hypothetical protein